MIQSVLLRRTVLEARFYSSTEPESSKNKSGSPGGGQGAPDSLQELISCR